jgi:hypothetical protein
VLGNFDRLRPLIGPALRFVVLSLLNCVVDSGCIRDFNSSATCSNLK